jgi:secreted trypsin-like serine protease
LKFPFLFFQIFFFNKIKRKLFKKMKTILAIFVLFFGVISAEFAWKNMTAEEMLELPEPVYQGLRRKYLQRDIVGGVEVNPKFKYPWTCTLEYLTSGQFCGGSLIDPNYILTAAHCSIGMNPTSVRTVCHRHDLDATQASEAAVQRSISRITIHPSYNRLTLTNDVAVWQLASPITNVETVAIDTNGDYDAAGVTSTVAGWGATREGGAGSDVLREVDVPIITNAKCNTQYGGDITDSMLCAGLDEGGKDACQGDSGGPLFVNKNSNPVQVGVVSWGTGCARPGYAGVYARVSYLSGWILDIIGNKN